MRVSFVFGSRSSYSFRYREEPQTTKSQPPTTNNERPTTNDQRPTTNDQTSDYSRAPRPSGSHTAESLPGRQQAVDERMRIRCRCMCPCRIGHAAVHPGVVAHLGHETKAAGGSDCPTEPEIQTPFLHPAVEVTLRNLVGIVEHAVFGGEKSRPELPQLKPCPGSASPERV